MSELPVVPIARPEHPIAAGTRIGHVHLRTADIDRIRDFYVGVLGFEITAEARDVPGWGTTGDVLFVSAGAYHHHVGFNVWRGRGIPAQPDGTVGLGHWTLVVPDAATLAVVAERLKAVGAPVEPHPEGLLARDPSGIAVVVTEQEQG